MKSRWCLILAAGIASALVCNPSLTQWALGQAPAEKEPLNVRYARAYLDLCKIDLQQAHNVNKSVAGTLTSSYLQPLEQAVRMAEEHLSDTLAEASGKQIAINLRNEEVAAKLAEINYQKAASANARVAGTVNDLELERLRLTAEVAKLTLEKARIASQTELGYLQWQVDQLHDEVYRLRNIVAQLARMN
jgi:hypothetical protein